MQCPMPAVDIPADLRIEIRANQLIYLTSQVPVGTKRHKGRRDFSLTSDQVRVRFKWGQLNRGKSTSLWNDTRHPHPQIQTGHKT
jgi:hypothetical protein